MAKNSNIGSLKVILKHGLILEDLISLGFSGQVNLATVLRTLQMNAIKSKSIKYRLNQY